MAQTRQYIEKQFSASLKKVKNKALPVKKFTFKSFDFYLLPISPFCQIVKISCFFIFINNNYMEDSGSATIK